MGFLGLAGKGTPVFCVMEKHGDYTGNSVNKASAQKLLEIFIPCFSRKLMKCCTGSWWTQSILINIARCMFLILCLGSHTRQIERILHRLSISIPMITMYGYEVESFQDPCIVAAEESVAVGGDLLLPGRSWINTFPVLRYVPPWFPGATTRRIAEKAREINRRVKEIPFDFVKKKVVSDNNSVYVSNSNFSQLFIA